MSFEAMGGEVTITFQIDSTGGEMLLASAKREIYRIESELSRFSVTSGLSRLNGRIGEWVQVSSTLFSNISLARQGSILTEGLFNPFILGALRAWGYEESVPQYRAKPQTCSVPDWRNIEIDPENRRIRIGAPIDLSGIAKGWTADRIANRLAKKGRCAVNICGDVATRGSSGAKEGWEIGFGKFASSYGPRKIVVNPPMGVATSGTKKRSWPIGDQVGHHIIDPRTGAPAETDVVSATILHSSATIAECFATAVVILGKNDGLTWLRRFGNVAACITCATGAWFTSDNFRWFADDNYWRRHE